MASNSSTIRYYNSDGTAEHQGLFFWFVVAASDEETDLTVGADKTKFPMGSDMTLTNVYAFVNDAPTDAALIIDINEDGSTILSTKITIDDGETGSNTAGTPPVISDASLAQFSMISIDVDQIGSTNAGKGLKIIFEGYITV